MVAIEYVSGAATIADVQAKAAAAGIGSYVAAPDLALQGVDTQGFTMLPKPAPVPNPVPIPAPTPVPTTTPTPLPAPAPSGSGLIVTVSEDAYQGDAQFVVTVDGSRVGGVYTATASHAAGQSQAITIAGIPENFTKHDIAVSFLNDAHGASPTANRNLYVNTIMFDNQPVQDSAAALFNNGTHHFIAAAPSGYTGA